MLTRGLGGTMIFGLVEAGFITNTQKHQVLNTFDSMGDKTTKITLCILQCKVI